MKAYENSLTETSSQEMPWCIISADNKEKAPIIVSDSILNPLYKLTSAWPVLDKQHQGMFMTIREKLQFMP